MPLTQQQEKLIKAAEAAARQAYVPASGFCVGAALETAGGIYTGCNVENASLSLSMCAERVAVFRAICAGEREFRELAVINLGGEDAVPCGACRQVLAEFAPELMVTYRYNGKFVKRSLNELFPSPFSRKKQLEQQ